MNEEHSSNQTETTKKSFFQSLIGRFFQGELKNREELVEVIRDSEQNDLIDQNTREMIEGVMEIAELRVRDIMIPRSQIVFIESNQDLDACLNTIIESAHSRFPVIADADDRDNVAGILHAKDLLRFLREDAEAFDLSALLRPAIVVPESKRVDRMLKEFRSERFHMAIVVDEFGAVSGLVTIEDVLEQIVGDIEDEFDEEDVADIRQLSRHTYAVRALTDIDDFNAQFIVDGVQRAREAFQRSLDGLRQELLQAGLPTNKVEEIVGKRQFSLQQIQENGVPQDKYEK